MFADLTVCLASASPRRADLLRQLGVEFFVRPANIDERQQAGEAAHDYVKRMAQEKALAVAGNDIATLVIGADTAIEIDGEILGKPADAGDHKRMLQQLADRTHHVLSAVCIARGARSAVALSITEVSFKPLSSAEIDAYLATREGLDKAGGYAIQGLAAAFVTRLCGSYSGVVGLPLYETVQLLRQITDG